MRADRTQDKGNLVSEEKDCRLSSEGRAARPFRDSRHTFSGNMNAIAYGVEAWFEENTGYSKRVVETTLEIARALGVPEGEIRRWASWRLTRDMEKGRVIKSLLERLQPSPVQPC